MIWKATSFSGAFGLAKVDEIIHSVNDCKISGKALTEPVAVYAPKNWIFVQGNAPVYTLRRMKSF